MNVVAEADYADRPADLLAVGVSLLRVRLLVAAFVFLACIGAAVVLGSVALALASLGALAAGAALPWIAVRGQLPHRGAEVRRWHLEATADELRRTSSDGLNSALPWTSFTRGRKTRWGWLLFAGGGYVAVPSRGFDSAGAASFEALIASRGLL